MRLNSLALRLFFSATTWTVVILVVTGVVLSSIYRTAVEHAFDRRLGVYLRSLAADVATADRTAAPRSTVGTCPHPLPALSGAARRSDPRCAVVSEARSHPTTSAVEYLVVREEFRIP
jgi:hypothetical protein